MTRIWKEFVSDDRKCIEEYYEAIMKDILQCASSRQWRQREASANGLADLVRYPFEMVEPHFEEAWRLMFRLMDDMKETVRVASLSLSRSLGGLTIKLCAPEATSKSELAKERCASAVSLVLPLLLEEGLLSRADAVRAFSVQHVAKLCEVGGELLEPHVMQLHFLMS